MMASGEDPGTCTAGAATTAASAGSPPRQSMETSPSPQSSGGDGVGNGSRDGGSGGGGGGGSRGGTATSSRGHDAGVNEGGGSWLRALSNSSLFRAPPANPQQKQLEVLAYVQLLAHFASESLVDEIGELVRRHYPSKQPMLLDTVLATFVLHQPEHSHAVLHSLLSCIIDRSLEYSPSSPPFNAFIDLFRASATVGPAEHRALACGETLRVLTHYNRPVQSNGDESNSHEAMPPRATATASASAVGTPAADSPATAAAGSPRSASPLSASSSPSSSSSGGGGGSGSENGHGSHHAGDRSGSGRVDNGRSGDGGAASVGPSHGGQQLDEAVPMEQAGGQGRNHGHRHRRHHHQQAHNHPHQHSHPHPHPHPYPYRNKRERVSPPRRFPSRPLTPWITDSLLAAPLDVRSDYFRWCGGVMGKYAAGAELRPPSKVVGFRGPGKHPQLQPSTPRWAVANGAAVILSVCDDEVARYDSASLTAAAVPALLLPPPSTGVDEHLIQGLPPLEPYARLFHRYYAISTPSATQRLLLGLLEAPPSWAPDALDAAVQLVELLRAAEDLGDSFQLPRTWLHLHFLRPIGTAMAMRGGGVASDAAAALLFRIFSQPSLLFPPPGHAQGLRTILPGGSLPLAHGRPLLEKAEIAAARANEEATARGVAALMREHGGEVEWGICALWEAALGLLPLKSSAVALPKMVVEAPLQPPMLSWNLLRPLLLVFQHLPAGSPSQTCLRRIFSSTVHAILERTFPRPPPAFSNPKLSSSPYASSPGVSQPPGQRGQFPSVTQRPNQEATRGSSSVWGGGGSSDRSAGMGELRAMVHHLFTEPCPSPEVASQLLADMLTTCMAYDADRRLLLLSASPLLPSSNQAAFAPGASSAPNLPGQQQLPAMPHSQLAAANVGNPQVGAEGGGASSLELVGAAVERDAQKDEMATDADKKTGAAGALGGGAAGEEAEKEARQQRRGAAAKERGALGTVDSYIVAAICALACEVQIASFVAAGRGRGQKGQSPLAAEKEKELLDAVLGPGLERDASAVATKGAAKDLRGRGSVSEAVYLKKVAQKSASKQAAAAEERQASRPQRTPQVEGKKSVGSVSAAGAAGRGGEAAAAVGGPAAAAAGGAAAAAAGAAAAAAAGGAAAAARAGDVAGDGGSSDGIWKFLPPFQQAVPDNSQRVLWLLETLLALVPASMVFELPGTTGENDSSDIVASAMVAAHVSKLLRRSKACIQALLAIQRCRLDEKVSLHASSVLALVEANSRAAKIAHAAAREEVKKKNLVSEALQAQEAERGNAMESEIARQVRVMEDENKSGRQEREQRGMEMEGDEVGAGGGGRGGGGREGGEGGGGIGQGGRDGEGLGTEGNSKKLTGEPSEPMSLSETSSDLGEKHLQSSSRDSSPPHKRVCGKKDGPAMSAADSGEKQRLGKDKEMKPCSSGGSGGSSGEGEGGYSFDAQDLAMLLVGNEQNGFHHAGGRSPLGSSTGSPGEDNAGYSLPGKDVGSPEDGTSNGNNNARNGGQAAERGHGSHAGPRYAMENFHQSFRAVSAASPRAVPAAAAAPAPAAGTSRGVKGSSGMRDGQKSLSASGQKLLLGLLLRKKELALAAVPLLWQRLVSAPETPVCPEGTSARTGWRKVVESLCTLVAAFPSSCAAAIVSQANIDMKPWALDGDSSSVPFCDASCPSPMADSATVPAAGLAMAATPASAAAAASAATVAGANFGCTAQQSWAQEGRKAKAEDVACHMRRQSQVWIVNTRIVNLLAELFRMNHEHMQDAVAVLAASRNLLLRATDGMAVDGEACTLPQLELLEAIALTAMQAQSWDENGTSISWCLMGVLERRLPDTVHCLSHGSALVRASSLALLRDMVYAESLPNQNDEFSTCTIDARRNLGGPRQLRQALEECLLWEMRSRKIVGLSINLLADAASTLGCRVRA